MGRIFLCLLIAVIVFVPLYYFCSSIGHRKPKSEDEDEDESDFDESDGQFVEDTELPPDGQYSQKLAESCIGKDYRFAYRRSECTQALAASEQLRSMWSKLEKVNPNNVFNREPNAMDQWFIESAEEFVKYGETMAYIEYHPALNDLFLNSLFEPWNNIELQKRLISICSDSRKVNYVNLLCKYLCRWDLASQIKAVVFYDKRFELVKRIYDLYHPMAHKKRHRRRNRKKKAANTAQ